MLTPEEKFRCWELVAQYAAPEKLLIAGTGVESVRETVDLTNRAAAMGYKVAMVRTPHYYKNLLQKPDAQALYFRAVADGAKIPLIIYNWPQATGIDIPAETVAQLSAHPEHHRHQGKLRQSRESDADDPRDGARLSSAGRLGPHALAVVRGRGGRGGAGVRQRRAVRLHHDLGSAPHARHRSRPRLAESHCPRRRCWSRRSTASPA